jgi:Putative peptidoglycan binding domain
VRSIWIASALSGTLTGLARKNNATQAKAWAEFPRPFGPRPPSNPTHTQGGGSAEPWEFNLKCRTALNPDYDYHDNSAGDYSDGQSLPAEVLSRNTIVAVQQLLYQLGYYQGPIDGVIGPQTARAVRWFQSVDTLSATGQIDGPTLKALGIS